jgi:hypothetical protein
MSWFHRHDETLNEKLRREADDSKDESAAEASVEDGTPDAEAQPKPDVESSGAIPPGWRAAGTSLGRRPPGNDVFATTAAPELTSDSQTFTTLPDGTVIVDESCDEDLSPLADAVEKYVQPPYTAMAERRENGLFYISARPIKVARFTAEGDDLELTSVDGVRTYSTDGETTDPTLAPDALAELGAARSRDYVAHATRIDDDFWETSIIPL